MVKCTCVTSLVVGRTVTVNHKQYQKTATKIIYSDGLLRLLGLRVFYCSMCLFLYGPFCHGVLKLDLSTLFTTFFLRTSLQFILYMRHSEVMRPGFFLMWRKGRSFMVF